MDTNFGIPDRRKITCKNMGMGRKLRRGIDIELVMDRYRWRSILVYKMESIRFE